MLRNQVGISNDLASLFCCRSSAEIITLSAARQLVRCHDNEVTLITALSMQQDNVIIYGRLKKKIFNSSLKLSHVKS
jgi:hypothetical protein